MTKKILKFLAVSPLVMIVCLITPAHSAGISPLGIAIVPPIQFPPEGFTVAGARVGLIFGNNFKVYGFDIGGIGNMTGQNMTGVQVAGGFNYNKGETHAVGIQAAGIGNWNINKVSVIGVQVAGLINSNKAESYMVGLTVAPINLTAHSKVIGIEAGLFNRAYEVYGFQIGVVNMAEMVHGLQIGLINFHHRGLFAISPILNFGF